MTVMLFLLGMINLFLGVVDIEASKTVQACFNFWVSGFCGAVSLTLLIDYIMNKG